jgi:hypothetical protein
MERRPESRRARGAVGGLILVTVGVVALGARGAGLELGNLAESAWPLFIIVPGVALLAAALVPSPPDGLGFAISGSVVTTVGLILLYQENSGNWESWAYVWALIPTAAGLAIALYGFLSGHRDIAGNGVRLAAVAGVLFLVGAWYFTAVFETGDNPIDVDTWWPVAVVVIGAIVMGRAVLMPPAPRTSTSADAAANGGDRS